MVMNAHHNPSPAPLKNVGVNSSGLVFTSWFVKKLMLFSIILSNNDLKYLNDARENPSESDLSPIEMKTYSELKVKTWSEWIKCKSLSPLNYAFVAFCALATSRWITVWTWLQSWHDCFSTFFWYFCLKWPINNGTIGNYAFIILLTSANMYSWQTVSFRYRNNSKFNLGENILVKGQVILIADLNPI